jgi:HNH endonuclease
MTRVLRIPLEQAQDRYEAGETLKEIALDAGVSYQTLGRRLADAGVILRGKAMTEETRRKLSEKKRLDIPVERLLLLYSCGLSCREMAQYLECNEETVRQRLIELGLPRLDAKARPEKNFFWRGGYAIDEDGYILEHCPHHPNATKSGYVRQHRLVMEKELGRLLRPWEVVDHKNGDTSDNDPSNLRLFASNAEHLRATLTGVKVPKAEREHLKREAVRRARQRVAAILGESGSDAGQ